jgi:hypothetical protein
MNYEELSNFLNSNHIVELDLSDSFESLKFNDSIYQSVKSLWLSSWVDE